MSSQDIDIRQKRNRYLFMICASLMTGNHLYFMGITGGKHIKSHAKKNLSKLHRHERPEHIFDAQGIPFSIVKALDPNTFDKFNSVFEWEHENLLGHSTSKDWRRWENCPCAQLTSRKIPVQQCWKENRTKSGPPVQMFFNNGEVLSTTHVVWDRNHQPLAKVYTESSIETKEIRND